MQQPVPTLPQIAPCPKCGNTDAKKVSYTWWGGFIGPKVFNHVKCTRCGYTYNGKTGKSNITAVIIYNVIILVVCLILYLILYSGMQ